MNAVTAPVAPVWPAPAGEGGLPRLLPPAGLAAGLAAHLGRHGPVPYRGAPRALIADVRASGLTGRGGAAFPVYRKLEAVATARTGRAVVVGNGAEGEPASHKDEALLTLAPHLVLDGLQLAAEAVGAGQAILYVRHDVLLRTRIETQISERAANGLDRVTVNLMPAPGRFVAGEESALSSLVSGGKGVPRFTPPRVFERGVDGRPTLVQNVETLAHLALIARHGPAWFRGLGTLNEPGTMLCTLRQADGSVTVAEAAIGTSLRALLDLGAASAVLVGGYHGAWIPAEQAARLTLSNSALRPLGGFTGAGVLAALPAGRCGLAEAAGVARYLALESAGQCGPCLNGLPSIAAAMTELANEGGWGGGRGPDPRVLADLTRWAGLVEGRGACHHPDGTVRFLRSALRVFADEVRAHRRGRCNGPDDRPFLPVPAGPDRGQEPDENWTRTGADR
jgi:NADH:ubiquinone oxidoreductase subunit F (NADH-binding)